MFRPFEVVKVDCPHCGTLNHVHGYEFKDAPYQPPRHECWHCWTWFDPTWETNAEIELQIVHDEKRQEMR